LVYAGLWRRLAAAIVDILALFLMLWMVNWASGSLLVQPIETFEPGAGETVVGSTHVVPTGFGFIVGFIFSWLYFALLQSSPRQATLGKIMFGMVVTDLDGRPIGFLRATRRFLGKIVSILILFIGLIMIAFTARHQGLHDMIAGTLVLRQGMAPAAARTEPPAH
jgi:uncharacterized RDD family membrane protein YckC